MSRWRAFFTHLAISLAVIGSLAAVFFFLWYPPRLLGFAGGAELLMLVAGVDIIAGPVLTLIVFKAGKKSLKFDLSAIALAQLCFLGYGLWTVWISRPVFIVAGERDFEVVFANEISEAALAAAEDPRFRSLPLFGAELVSTRERRDQAERDEVRGAELVGGGMSKMPKYFQAFELAKDRTLSIARGPDQLDAFAWYLDPEVRARLEGQYKDQPSARFAPAASSRGIVLFRIDPTTARPVEYVGSE